VVVAGADLILRGFMKTARFLRTGLWELAREDW
jgi:hypothetical protein